jgi:hypothetical protein
MQTAFFGHFGGFEIYLLLVIFVLPLFLWIIAIIDLVQRKFRDSTNKIVCALVILIIPALRSILYLIIGRKGGVK